MNLLRLARLAAALLATALPALLHAALPSLTINGESFTYNAPSGTVTGRLKVPAGSGPFPAVLLSHGKGGTAATMMNNHGVLLVEAGLVCIAPDYTHAGPAVNTPDNEGYCPENSRRARACLDILASLGNVDTARIGAFGHSMGSYLTAGLLGESGIGIRAAAISAGGTYGGTDTAVASPATTEVQNITAPLLMFHGSTDMTVVPQQSATLASILAAKGTVHRRLLYTGVGHDIVNVKKSDIHALLRAWFTTHGILTQPANTAPIVSAPPTLSATAGIPSAPTTITLGDTSTPAADLTLSVFSTNDARLPASSLTLAGSGSTRTLTLTPSAGTTESVELALVASDGALNTAAFLTVAISAGGSATTVNHRPTITRIAEQRTTPGTAITGLSFTIGDVETSATALTVTAASSNPILLPPAALTLSGSNASRTLSLSPAAGLSGTATITLTVSDGEKSTASAFTLTVASTIAGNTPPVIQSLPDALLASGETFGPFPLVIKDDESAESALTLSATSSNTDLIPTSAIVFGGQNWGRSVTITPASGKTGRATLTFTVSDGTRTASSACVLEVISGNTPPAITGLPSCVTQLITATDSVVTFSLSDTETSAEKLHVTAASSHTTLLPDSSLALSGTGATRTLTLLPTPAATGAATITLTVSDGSFTRRSQFLFVVHDPAAPSAQFERPRGIFALDSSIGTSYTTTFGKTISLRDAGIRDQTFVKGYALRLGWCYLESDTTPGAYDFTPLKNILQKLPAGQQLSLLIMPGEPAYIAQTPGVATWTDEGVLRAQPWSPYLRERRRAFIQALAAFIADEVTLASEPRLIAINPDLPGAFNGIRDPNETRLRNIPGYTRANFFAAQRDEIHAWQNAFPGKFIQIGFWPVVDNEDAAYSGLTAWEWMRQQLLAEFNGTLRPRLGFFMDNLAAKRAASPEAPYTATPMTTFGAPLALSRDGAWTAFQMLGSWARPFNDSHVTNTLNGSPSEALEYAFNTFRTEYHEVYTADLDTPLYQPALQRWADFFSGDLEPTPSDPDPTPPSPNPPTPPITTPTTPAAPPATSSGGGGSPSLLFLAALTILSALRLAKFRLPIPVCD